MLKRLQPISEEEKRAEKIQTGGREELKENERDGSDVVELQTKNLLNTSGTNSKSTNPSSSSSSSQSNPS